MSATVKAIRGSNLEWSRTYLPHTRKVQHQECVTEQGTYILRHHRNYRLSFTPIQGEEIDLGEYEFRRDCDARLVAHHNTQT